MLMNSSTDPNETVYLKKNSIDRSIGYLVAGVAVLLFFLVYLVGLGKVQSRSDNVVGTEKVVDEEKPAEIGAFSSPPENDQSSQ